MSDLEAIRSVLDKAARRRRWVRAWNGLFSGLFIAALVWLLVIVKFKLLPLPFGTLGGAGILAVLLVVGGFVWGLWRKDSWLETARWLDYKLGFKERLSAAIEFSRSPGPWGDVLLRDGAKCVAKIQANQLLPYHLPKIARWTVLLLFVGATLGFVPEYRSQKYLDAQREQAVIKETGQQLESFAQRSLQQRPPKMKPTEKAMVSVEELGEQLQSAKLTRADALEKIASVTQKLKAEAKDLNENPAFKRLRQAARTPPNASSSSAASLQKKIQALQQQMADNSGDPDTLQKLKHKMNQLQSAAASMNSSEIGMSPEMKQQMASSMASLAQMAQQQGVSLPDLEDAISALQYGEVDQFLKALDSAQIDLDKMLEMAKAMKKMQMEMAELGRDLGEQLEKGQAQAAHERLLDMIRKLQSGSLDSGELQKLADEVSRALDPAGDYGAVRKHLEQALQQCQGGNLRKGAQSLQSAADELKRLMGQFGDVQSLMASLDALQKAQMCVGNCTGWGMATTMAGFKPGGKPGRGVGTWADENNGWFYFPETGRWNNSGIVQPELEPRGHTDRGEGDGLAGMIPTKIRGRFTPGGPMPSITLQGVSIKGESRMVNIEEAIATAQDEAQSALSQQKIPRAYQQAVRSYFDDMSQ
ncbi:MAG: hypothetical protein M2R45_02137 [Verrucomicrobia subdivision 3 bacterium]|nr:hypothetical protein [Limisphaerales bacterium]MCS1413714.1 hypothetical protein [Limisphaerales bacterium]